MIVLLLTSRPRVVVRVSSMWRGGTLNASLAILKLGVPLGVWLRW